ncbi:5-methyltetrahydropteroyltriglutamate--homocysteine S-methyltransferase [Zhihengliuella salsuginis]|uniref:5-methyltetrahydropteroyltriglutamate--homocysteine S-methyltransferase n=1 Tax=Zhihengliuella salsuginis TaxID=578222 RepID=A0ABQ3GF22_9MICC|nr:5-methyltetrahydropteroyltriglutamate--homocysteine S-methyltransferase [Zhihengliuella salsuginis]GHD02520.1 5-methyltetrahydropteroyltriglutamate--homocysteine methyltransferase [Zhihengliuella salsuginis]
MSSNTFPNATILGYPRIGPNRELKKAVESYWKGDSTHAELNAAAEALQDRTIDRLVELGLSAADSSIPADFALYDQVLDTTAALGALPQRFADLGGPDGEVGTDAYFTLARGDKERQPLEMTKWFDTNYHYLVPEIGPETPFRALADGLAGIVKRQSARGNTLRPVLVGPVTYLLLSKPEEGAPEGFDPLDRLDDAVAAYRGIIAQLAAAGAEWVQLDEPGLVTERGSTLVPLAEKAYAALAGEKEYDGVARPSLFVTTGYGTAGDITAPGAGLAALASTGIEAVHADLVRGAIPAAGQLTALGATRLVAGVVDGRNIWRNDLAASLQTLVGLESAVAGDLAVATTTSMLHVPHDVTLEPSLPEHLPGWLAFADQKVAEVLTLAKGLADGTAGIEAEIAASDAAIEHRASFAGTRVESVRQRQAALTEQDIDRAPAEQRAEAQKARLNLPDLPTTTIGSFPQTGEVRKARAEFRAGKITAEQYDQFLKEEIARVVALQEDLGLDVLVHGEPERNDMVQYFAENFDGFAETVNGWVQSYGSRCTRPSILWGDVTRPAAFTAPWTRYAQSLTEKPLKGMLTGPVTILAWSFVRNDQPLGETADQVALALRDEIADLEADGTAIIQVDEPALRELLPLRAADQASYLKWSVESFRLATSGVRPDTQIHTHLCYSEFGEVIAGIDGLNADVTSIEAARSKMEVAADLAEFGYRRGVGPGVYDIHSPRVPSTEEVESLIKTAIANVPLPQLWINPDCGLKTRGYEETVASLRNVVAATESARAALLAEVPA